MIEILVFAGIPILLLLLLSLLGATWNLEVDQPDEMDEALKDHCPAGRDSALCIQRIFSREDQRFVDHLGSERLRQIYRAERTRVALFWVRSISNDVRRIMREHRLAAPTKQNLQVRRELELVQQYVEFHILAYILVFSIRVFGPHALGEMATRVMHASQGIDKVLEASTAASRIQPAGNLGGA